uniref:Uncharacterized protein n=1 Tax=Caloglossa beccarii TaxID=131038 RepID=A0A1Z1M898_9FLOR|nr:hypothetical protein [Caloglossa beccarii]ARW62200.1 hypothetical protein [Caloglossa beccarii]
MIKYWPTKSSLKLNYCVINLFYTTKIKIKNDLSNQTKYYLHTDIINKLYKKKLLFIIIKELETLILDIIELNLTANNIKQLKYRILYDFLDITSEKFILTFDIKYKNYLKQKFQDNYFFYAQSDYHRILDLENYILIDNLLIYLVFGSSCIDDKIFLFNKFYTPYKHVQILFENFIIQFSSYIINNISKHFLCLSDMLHFFKLNYICNSSYISTRSVALFFNSIKWQNFLYRYFYQPKLIYNAYYKVWLFHSRGITSEYIYLSRLNNLQKLSDIQVLFLFILEIKDILVPKIEKLLITIFQYVTYIFINIINNFFILIIKAILFTIQNYNKV